MNAQALTFTGERFLPGTAGEIWYEHWHRYHFAAPLVAGRRVLDVACGEGYGSALLARTAADVTGVDVADAAIAHARERYAGVPHLAFAAADCTRLPFPDAHFDAVVSFETVEHLAAQEAFVDEVRRVLRPGGLFIASSPNRPEYSEARGVVNPYHVRELDRGELTSLLAPRFAHLAWYRQQPSFYSLIWPEASGEMRGSVMEATEDDASRVESGRTGARYFIVLASDRPGTLAGIAPRVSVFADRDEWVRSDYEKVTAELDAAQRRGNALEQQVIGWQQHHDEAVRQRDALRVERDAFGARLAEADAKVREAAANLGVLTATVDAQRREIARRASVRWWLALPWRRIANALRGRRPEA